MHIALTADKLMRAAADQYPWSEKKAAIKRILMVGATRNVDGSLSDNDCVYLRDFLHIAQRFNLPLSRAFNIVSCNLQDNQDFIRQYNPRLKDAGEDAPQVDAVIFCYLYFGYNTFRPGDPPATRQSPFADSALMWQGALDACGAKLVLNVSGGDELPTRLIQSPSFRHVYEHGRNHFLVHEETAKARGIHAVPDTSSHYTDGWKIGRRTPV